MTSLIRLGRYQLVLVRNEQDNYTLLTGLRKLLIRYRSYRTVARQRKQLAQLPDYLLKDIGVSRAEAMEEAAKPFWK